VTFCIFFTFTLRLASIYNDSIDRISNGVMDAIYSVKESGKARHIGFTGHQNPYAHLRMMDRFSEFPGFATLQMPLSVVDFASEHSFVRKTLPLALENNLGLLAMKTLAAGRFFGRTRLFCLRKLSTFTGYFERIINSKKVSGWPTKAHISSL
jgi:aryl-alcohol dehydrogenase-like predicted oxidoreductase